MPLRPLVHALFAFTLLTAGFAAVAQAKKSAPAQHPTGPEPILRANFLAQMDAQFGKMDGDRNGQLSRTEIEQYEQQNALAEAQARNDALFDRLGWTRREGDTRTVTLSVPAGEAIRAQKGPGIQQSVP